MIDCRALGLAQLHPSQRDQTQMVNWGLPRWMGAEQEWGTEPEGSLAPGQLSRRPEPGVSNLLPSLSTKGSGLASHTWQSGVEENRFFPQSWFQWPLWSQPQSGKDLCGEDVGGADLEPQSQGWQSDDRRQGRLWKRFWEKAG